VSAAIPIHTVGPGVLAPHFQLQTQGWDAQGRSYFVAEQPTGVNATGEPAGSMVLHVVILDTATVRTTLR
jgi:hypothetical protein